MRHLLRNTVLAVAALAVLAILALASPPGHGLVAGLLERAAAGNGLTVTIEGLSGWPPFWLGADKVVVADANGPFAEVDNLAIDVRPTALLTGTIAFDSIAADRVSVERAPHLEENGDGGGLLPFAVDSLALARVELGAALAGRPAVLTVSGSAAAGASGSLSATLDARRIDGGNGTLAATLGRENAGAPLDVDLALSEGADGILVGLIGQASGPGYTLTARTGVSGGTVTGSVSLRSQGAAGFEGTFTVSPTKEAGQHIVLNGKGDLAELVPPDYAGLLSGAIDVAIDADVVREAGKPLPRIAIRQGSVKTGSVIAEASGTLGDAAANLSLKVDVARPDGGRISLPAIPALSGFRSLAITGKVAPIGNVIRMDLTGRAVGLEAAGVTLPGVGASLAVEANGDDPLASTSLPFGLRIETDAVLTDGGRVDAAGGMPIVLTADGAFDTQAASAKTTARLSLAGGETGFDGTLSAAGVAGKATVSYGDLKPLAPLIGRAVSGAISATLSGTFAGPEPKFTVAAEATDLDPGDATAAKLLAGDSTIDATVDLANGALAVRDFSIASRAIAAKGGITLDDASIEAALEGTIADLSVLAQASSGAAAFGAKVSGARQRPTVDATIKVAEGAILGKAVDNATATFTGAPMDNGWQGALTLDGSFGGKPLSGTATASLDPASGRLAFPDVNIAVGGNRVTGTIARTAAGPLQGTLAVEAPDLATLAAVALVDARGAATAHVEFAPDGARQKVTLSFAGKGIATGSLTARMLAGNAEVDDAFGAPAIKGSVTAEGMTAGSIRLDTAAATASVSAGQTTFEAKAKGPDLDLTGTGSLGGARGGHTISLDTLTGTAYGSPVRLAAPVAIALGGATSSIAGADIAIGGGRVRVSGPLSPTLDLAITAEGVSAAVVNGFAPTLGAAGTVSGKATVSGRGGAIAYTWQANWAGLQVAATRSAGLPGLTLSARGQGSGTATSLNATLSGAGLSLAIAGNVPFQGGGLALTVTGTAPLALLALTSSRELRLAGDARLNLRIGGAIGAPQIAGTADLANATAADLGSGLGVSGASGRIAFDGGRATTGGITARLSQGGDVTIAGSVDITSAGLPANLTIRVANGRYVDGTLINAQLGSADLTLTGPLLGNGTLAGQVNLSRAEVQLPDKFGGATTAIPVEHINTPPGFTPPVAREPASSANGGSDGGTLALDVTLNAGTGGVFVRGFGIDSELGGSLRLAGTTGDPQAIGAFTMNRGRIEMIGKRFDFTSGTLTFSGDLIPRLDFEATTQTSDSVVTLHVSGPANDPVISFTSSPSLPQEEILSRLLFDRQVGSLSPLQAAQLVDAVAQMTGALGGTSLFTRVRQATGLDNLDIRQNASGGTTVGLGKRINDRLSVGVEAGSDTGGGRVTVDIDITKNLKASASAGENGNGKVGLSFEKEY